MPRRRRHLLSILAAGAAVAVAAAGLQPGPAQAKPKPPKPTKVVIIVVDALSKEIVDKYGMANVQGLMADYVDTPKGYLGHTGSVTVVTHNVITSGLLPKHTGWTTEGYRDVDNILPNPKPATPATTSSSPATGTTTSIYAVQNYYGYPKLADYLNETAPSRRSARRCTPRYAFGGAGHRHRSSRFGGATCTACAGTARPVYGVLRRPRIGSRRYISGACGSRYLVERDKVYDTGKLPASHLPARRRPLRRRPRRRRTQGGDVWATDAALDVMDNEDWSGIFVTLPGRRQGGPHVGRRQRPRTRRVADGDADDAPGRTPPTPPTHQVGRIMDALEAERRARQHPRRADRRPRVGRRRRTPPNGTVHRPALPRHCVHAGPDCGLNNWYYGDVENDAYLDRRRPALQPLIDTGQRRPLLQRLLDQRLAHRPVAREEGRGGRAHGRACPTSPRCGATTATTSRWSRRSATT